MEGLHGSILLDKSVDFSLRILNLKRYLRKAHKEFSMSDQLFRSGTSIGANIHEAYFGQSKKDFIARLGIALKECGESQYWIKVLWRGGYLSEKEYRSIQSDCVELGKMLSASIKTAKSKQSNLIDDIEDEEIF